MTVAELIKVLIDLPQDLDVFCLDQGCDSEAYFPVEYIVLKEDWEGNADFVALS